MQNIYKSALLAALGLASVTMAQAVTYNGDLLAGFTVQNGNDLVYDLGPAGALVNGSSWNLLTALTAAGLNNSLNSVQWGVVGSSNTTTGPNARTEWLTDLSTPDTINNGEYASINTSVGALVVNDFTAVGAGNYVTPADTLTYSWNQETAQGASAPGGAYSSAYTNPNFTGLGSIAFYSSTGAGVVTNLGSFSLSASGVLTFNVVASTPPAPKIVSVTRTGSTSTVYFTTTNAFTYTLYYTNSAGLGAPVSSWPASPTTLMGNGNTNSLSDTTTDTNRFYRIGVH